MLGIEPEIGLFAGTPVAGGCGSGSERAGNAPISGVRQRPRMP